MRKLLPFAACLTLWSLLPLLASSQITVPTVRANFGVDADLKSNYVTTLAQQDDDDWFMYPGTTGSGQFIIDTSGAAALNVRYLSDVASRRLSFIKRMRYPVFTLLNNKLLLDAAFVRDFHGSDSTVFASGSNKNGDNPADWSCPPTQNVPDKNDILDLMVHVRRAGPAATDSLWMFGGLSLDNITGNRYFDFEMYQTNLVYDRSTLTFTGYGPDAGHTSWEFDAAGNVTKAGDIIFSAEYQSSSITMIEARIWINSASLSVTPATFDWSGKFDGAYAGATFGYASIMPKSDGTYFTGLQSSSTTWGGPFSIVLQDDAVVSDYLAKQYVEFSVNLSKLGLDPSNMLAGSNCTMPFSSLLVKTRASSSFTAELKDFVLPLVFFAPEKAIAKTPTPFLCEKLNVAEISVGNPVSTSIYQWSTTDGNIISATTGPTIYVDKPGTYIVNQFLLAGCNTYATDSITLLPFPFCGVLSANAIYNFRGNTDNGGTRLTWQVQDNQLVNHFELEKSADGINFTRIADVKRNATAIGNAYSFQLGDAYRDDQTVRFRVVLVNNDGSKVFSPVIQPALPKTGSFTVKIYPNPVKNWLSAEIFSPIDDVATVTLYNAGGSKLFSSTRQVKPGWTILNFPSLPAMNKGLGFVVVSTANSVVSQKILLAQ